MKNVEIVAVDGPMWTVVHALLRRSYKSEANLIEYSGLPPLADSIDDLRQSSEIFRAAVEGQAVLGCISWEQLSDGARICRLGVDHNALRRGVASLLVRAALQANPGRRVTVQTASLNYPAIALYERVGFALSTRWRLPDDLELVELVYRDNEDVV